MAYLTKQRLVVELLKRINLGLNVSKHCYRH